MPSAAAASDARGVEPARVGDASPRSGEVVAPGVEGDAAGQEAGREPEVERAVHVAAPQRRAGTSHRAARPGRPRPARRASADSATDCRPRITTMSPSRPSSAPVAVRSDRHRTRCRRPRPRVRTAAIEPASPGAWRSTVDAYGVSPDACGEISITGTPRSAAARRTRRYRTGSSSLRSGPSSTIAARVIDVGDRRARQAEHDLRGEAVGELGVDVVGAEHALGEARPRVRVLVGAARAADHGAIAAGASASTRQAGGGGVERLGPRHLDQLARLAHHRRPHAVGAVHPLVAVATLVAQPALVHRLGVDAEQAHDPVRRRLAARRGTRPRTSGTTSRRSRGPTGGRGTGTRSR